MAVNVKTKVRKTGTCPDRRLGGRSRSSFCFISLSNVRSWSTFWLLIVIIVPLFTDIKPSNGDVSHCSRSEGSPRLGEHAHVAVGRDRPEVVVLIDNLSDGIDRVSSNLDQDDAGRILREPGGVLLEPLGRQFDAVVFLVTGVNNAAGGLVGRFTDGVT